MATQVAREGAFRWERLFAWLTGWAALGSMWLWHGFDVRGYAETMVAITLSLGAAYVAARQLRARMWHEAQVRLADGRLTIDYEDGDLRDIRVENIASAGGEAPLVVRLHSGEVFRIAGPRAGTLADEINEQRGAAAVVPAGLRADENEQWRYHRAVWAVGGWLILMLLSGNDSVWAIGTWPSLPILAFLATMWTAIGLAASTRRRATIGRDGIHLRGRFIPFGDIDAVGRHARAVRIKLQNTSLDIPDNSGELTAALTSALDAFRSARGARLRLLDRDDKTFEQWCTMLTGLLDQHDYRAEALRVEDLEALLADAGAEPEQRIAAAIALPKDDRRRDRIRIAAAESADGDIRAALEAAAEEELSEEHMRPWLE